MANSIELRQTNPQHKVNPHRLTVRCIAPGVGPFNPVFKDYYLSETTATASIHELLFNMHKDGDNYWVGVVVPAVAIDFTKVQVFFHPKPAGGGAFDKDYAQLTSRGWQAKYDHMWYLGVQLGAVRRTLLIYPFMRESAFSRHSPTFMFATRPRETLSAIVSAARTAVTGKTGEVDVGQIGVSGFSSGVEGMYHFAATFASSVVETTNLDNPLGKGEPRTVGAVGRVISQIPPAVPKTPGYIYLPGWKFKFITKTEYADNVHRQIGYLTFAPAMAQSRIV